QTLCVRPLSQDQQGIIGGITVKPGLHVQILLKFPAVCSHFICDLLGQLIAAAPVIFAFCNKSRLFIVLRHCRYILHGVKIVLHTLCLAFDFLGFFRFCGCVCCVCLVLPDFSFEIASFPLLSASFFLAAFISLSSFRTDGFFGTDGAYSLEVPSAVL